MATTAREPLSRERIFQCALRIVDEEGLDELSMRRLGQELGVEAMSLYHHVPSKRALLEGIVDTVLAEFEIPPADGSAWAERVRDLARRYRRLAHAHPNAFPLLITADLKTERFLHLIGAMMDVCQEAGFANEETALDAFCTLGSYVNGFALFEIGGFLALAVDEAADDARGNGRECAPGAFPRLFQYGDEQFEFGLDVILAGLVAQITAAEETAP